MSDEMDDEIEEGSDDEFEEGEDFEEEDLEAGAEDEELGDEEIDLDEPLDEFAEGDVEVAEVAEEEEEDEEEAPRPTARKVADDEEEDDEDDPDDVEADLEAILRDRMAAADDEDEDETEDAGDGPKSEAGGNPRSDEFVCDSCFLLVNRSQFGSARDPRCPMGDTECPSIVKIFG